MRFIITAQSSAEKTATDQHPEFDVELFKAYMRFNEEMHQAGVLVASEGLNPAAKGARVAVDGGKRYIVDGPFAESKELVGGFYLIDVASLDEAVQWALRAPSGSRTDDVLEIRQLTGSGDLPPEILQLVTEAAPTWSAAWQSLNANKSQAKGAC
ncbi:dehydrogenase [Luteimonas sp. SJ-92]|uniref:Dehydrogenase n=1 Tax=Luteimonas salinisoli TaxID=2752307 RepID=A0A853JC85_9GAMM|nr:YciI family protein [Luteimonas salinisoli]NZA26249.1 dehydrogenase [Luteimonas salinisoli]